MFRVVIAFSDRADRFHIYQPGDIYPRAGVEVDEKRLAELSGSHNNIGCPLIIAAQPVERRTTRKRVKTND